MLRNQRLETYIYIQSGVSDGPKSTNFMSYDKDNISNI